MLHYRKGNGYFFFLSSRLHRIKTEVIFNISSLPTQIYLLYLLYIILAISQQIACLTFTVSFRDFVFEIIKTTHAF